jgi:hypothetical protein
VPHIIEPLDIQNVAGDAHALHVVPAAHVCPLTSFSSAPHASAAFVHQ